MMTGFTRLLGGWLVSPGLLAAGALLVSAPIIIHLLAKRKFKTVDWAAMDFLVEADRRNRRRIRLEDLLLLALRCLAVLLVALLVARPFSSLRRLGGLLGSARFERVIVLDDSPSMTARAGGSSAWQNAKRRLVDFLGGLAATGSGDSLTLLLTSRPQRPVFNGLPINDETVTEITDEINGLEASDLCADFDAALLEIERASDRRSADVNRMIYVLSDMRRRDWAAERAAQSKGLFGTLQRVAEHAAGCFLVDVAEDGAAGSGAVDEGAGNLAVTRIMPLDKVLAAGVASRFEVTVENMGPQDAGGIQVRFTAGDSVPLRGEIGRLPAGGTASVPFTYTFARPEDGRVAPALESVPERVPIRAEISVEEDPSADRLAADNVRYYAARVRGGMPTLVVDGEPSATYGRSESFFLARALAPPGEFLSGIAVNTVTDADFEAIPLDQYRVVYLCNVYRLSDERRNALETWVKSGGGLVVALGDQVDEEYYNQELYRDGEGLFPLRLETIHGDESEQEWVYFDAGSSSHPALGVFEGEGNPFIESVKVFRWWSGSLSEDQRRAGHVSLAARFTDGDGSTAVVERAYGDGRVVALATAVDADWGNWPEDPSYVIAMQELTRYVARASGDQGSMLVGQPLRHPLDLAKYRTDVSISGPGIDRTLIQPGPSADAGQSGDASVWYASYDETSRRGFYEMALTRTDGEPEKVLFAANIDATEGNLKRVDEHLLRRDLGDARVEMVRGAEMAGVSAEAAKGELWRYVLGALVLVLCVEQLLGWWFGLRR
jgi:hypothetical protein